MSLAALQSALDDAAAALAAGDAARAAAAVTRAADTCATLARARTRVPADVLSRLRERHAEVLAAAGAVHRRLEAELARAGRSRQATRAYAAR